MTGKKTLIILIFIFFLNQNLAFSHILHYESLNKLEFDLYRNNQFIGQHVYLFDREGKRLIVQSTISFEIKILGVSLYKYFSEGKEEYLDGKFRNFSSTTNQNKKEKFVKIYTKKDQFFIEGSSFKGAAPKNFIIGTWWNHEIVKSKSQISAVSGRIIKQKVTFLGKESIIIDGKTYNTLHFNFSSTDRKLKKDKKLNTDVWYDEQTLNWVRATFKKKGNWEYKLILIE